MLTPQLAPETVARITAAYTDTVAAIYAASTIEKLATIYEREVGYNPLTDEPNQSASELRDTLIDYQREACYANGIDCEAVGILTDADGVAYGEGA